MRESEFGKAEHLDVVPPDEGLERHSGYSEFVIPKSFWFEPGHPQPFKFVI